MPARALDKVTISFGLVSIPTKIFSTNEPAESISFHWLHESCGSRVKQKYYCEKDDEIVERDQLVKGYEYAKNKYVELTEEEIDALEAQASNTIAIQEFVPVSAIDPIYVDKSYYLGPDKGGEHAYALLTKAMVKAELAGVAHYAARGKEYIVMVRPFKNGLVMHQLRYADEIKPWDEVPMPDLPRVREAELDLAGQVIAGIAHETFDPRPYRDEVKDRMRKALEAKVEGEEITAPEPPPKADVVDLMEALKQSLAGAGKAKPKRAARADAPRRAARRTPAKRGKRR